MVSPSSKMIDPADLITKATAARLRGVQRSSMHYLIKRYRLKVTMIDNVPFVSRAAVKALPRKRERRPST